MSQSSVITSDTSLAQVEAYMHGSFQADLWHCTALTPVLNVIGGNLRSGGCEAGSLGPQIGGLSAEDLLQWGCVIQSHVKNTLTKNG
jgi:hypothetical protein